MKIDNGMLYFAFFRKLKKLLGLAERLSERPFDEDVFTCFKTWTNSGQMSVYSNAADDEFNILIVCEI